MKKLLLSALCITGIAYTTIARADLVRFDNGVGMGGCTTANCRSFSDLEGTGFGDQPRVLTLQTDTFEAGQVQPNAVGGVAFPTFPNVGAPGIPAGTNNAIAGADKASAPSLSALGWTDASKVGIGFDSDQTGNTGITLQTLSLNLYQQTLSGVTLLHTFSIAGAINYTQAELAEQPGNGNDAFTFILDAAQQAIWNALVTGQSLDLFNIGLAASLGCNTTPSGTCQVSNDGPDSFIAIAQPGAPILTPLPAAGWLFGSGLAGLMVLTRRKRNLVR